MNKRSAQTASVDLAAAETILKKQRKRTYNVGDCVYLDHQDTTSATEFPYTIVSVSGNILDHKTMHEKLKKIVYAFKGADTWVVAPTNPACRNPRLSCHSLRSGEGEIQQYRCIVTCDEYGIHRFYRLSETDEWRSILATSNIPTKADVYCRGNRIKDRSPTDIHTQGQLGTEICLISDDLYYSEEGMRVRLAWWREKLEAKGFTDANPVYIMPSDPEFEITTQLPVVQAAPEQPEIVEINETSDSPKPGLDDLKEHLQRLKDILSDPRTLQLINSIKCDP